MVALNETISGLTGLGADIGGMIGELFTALIPWVVLVMIIGAVVYGLIALFKSMGKAIKVR